MTKIGKIIYAARSRRGLTQTQLAKKIGVTQALISQWENDRSVPSQTLKEKLEKVLGPLQDMAKLEDIAQQIRELVEQYPVSVPNIAQEASLTPPTVYAILNGSVTFPREGTVGQVRKALRNLRERHGEKEDSKVNYRGAAEEGKPEKLAFLAEAGVGQKIRSIRFFNPHNSRQFSKVPNTPGVYLLYAGGNNLAFDLAFKSNEPIIFDKIKMVGTPEYIGKANKLRTRIMQHRKDWWWREDWIELAICIEVDGRGNLHEDLETLLIKLLSPQLNVRQQGMYVNEG